MSSEFVGSSEALSDTGLASVADSLGVEAAEIWTVLAVETSGCGFLANRRPPILYERHYFHRLTDGRFDDGDISDPTAGGYGKGGEAQYDRLERAIALDREAALRSASWGMAQIMGDNFQKCGYPGVEGMVSDMCASEDRQLAAFASFLKSTKLDAPLKAHDWTSLAKGYNGPSFAKNEYDKKLKDQFAKYSAGSLPDLQVRTAQLYLTFLGFKPGPVDGLMGTKTRTALTTFQGQQGLAASGNADAETVARLREMMVGAGAGAA